MCAKFDGVNDGLNLAGAINWLNGKAAATMTAWVQRQGGATPNMEFLFLSRNGGVTPRAEFEFDPPPSNAFAGYASAGDATGFQFGLSAAGVLPIDAGTPGTWVHAACVFDVAGDKIIWYVNGVLSTTTVVAFPGATFSASVLGNVNTIGFQTDAITKFDWFQGTMSDLRLYERILNSDEIKCMARMRGHDGIRGSMALKFDFRGQNTIALSTANVLNSSPLPQAITTFATLESLPVFARDTIALRRRT